MEDRGTWTIGVRGCCTEFSSRYPHGFAEVTSGGVVLVCIDWCTAKHTASARAVAVLLHRKSLLTHPQQTLPWVGCFHLIHASNPNCTFQTGKWRRALKIKFFFFNKFSLFPLFVNFCKKSNCSPSFLECIQLSKFNDVVTTKWQLSALIQ